MLQPTFLGHQNKGNNDSRIFVSLGLRETYTEQTPFKQKINITCLEGRKRTRVCAQTTNFYHLKTCNLLENVWFPGTGLTDSLCNEQLKCEWKQVGGVQTMRSEGKGLQSCENKFFFSFFNAFLPERQSLLLKKEQAGETPKCQKLHSTGIYLVKTIFQ